MTVYRTTATFDLVTDYDPTQRMAHLHADQGDGRCECGATVTRYRVVEAMPASAGETVEYSAYVIEITTGG